MQNIKDHLITSVTVLIFSYITAVTINLFIKNSFVYYPSEKATRKLLVSSRDMAQNIEIDKIMGTGFFPDFSVEASDLSNESTGNSDLDDLKLLGTITGSDSIKMAMIMKKGDKQPGVYRLWGDVGGFKLTRIEATAVYLKRNNEKFTLNLYEKKEKTSDSSTVDTTGETIKRTVSRAEVQQKVMNNIDKAMEGIKGGPYKINNNIEGFRIIRIRPTNILYEYGMRNGDIIKRVNGKKMDSTVKLLNMWQSFSSESKLVIDVERNGQMIVFDITITD